MNLHMYTYMYVHSVDLNQIWHLPPQLGLPYARNVTMPTLINVSIEEALTLLVRMQPTYACMCV